MKKRFLSMLLVLTMVLSLMPAMSLTAAATEEHSHEGWTAWTSDTTLPSEAGKYYLETNVTLSGSSNVWYVWNCDIDLCLNGHTVTLDSGAYIKVMSGKTLNLYDCPEVDWRGNITEGCVTGGSSTDGAVYIVGENSAFIMNGGIIKNSPTFGVKVAEKSTFTMNGGTIRDNGNSTSGKGGGVNIAESTFTMNGGTIYDNTANVGGGVHVEGSAQGPATFTMNGGVIRGNKAANGAGVYINGLVGTSTFNMSGGIVTDNTSSNTGNGGGVYCSYWNNDNTRFVVGGTAVVTGNTGGQDNGTNNVYLQSSSKVTLGTGANGVPAPANGMRVYINGAEGDTFVTSGAKATDAKYFSADNEGLGVGYEADGTLKLVGAVANKLWVAGIRVTELNKGNVLGDNTSTVSYDNDTNTLTLNGANISFGEGDDASYETAANSGIYYKGNTALNIVVSGTNTFTAKKPERGCAAIYSDDTAAAVTISGSDKTMDQLVFTTEPLSDRSEHFQSEAIVGHYNVSLDTVGVTVSDYNIGIASSDNLTVTDSALDITVRNNALQAYKNSNESSITLTDSTVFAYSYGAPAILADANLCITDNSVVEAYSQIGESNSGIQYGGDFIIDNTSRLVACGSWGAINGTVSESDKTGFTVSADYFGEATTAWTDEVYPQKVVYGEITPTILPLFVAGQPVRKDKVADILGDGKVSYNIAKNTLTLNGETMTGIVHPMKIDYSESRIGIYSLMPTLTVHVTGTNQLGATIEGNGDYADDYSLDFGIAAKGDLTFTGSGNLTINDYIAGIQAGDEQTKGDVTFGSGYTGTVTVHDCGKNQLSCAIQTTGNVSLLGGTFDLTNKNTRGIMTMGTLTINNGTGTVTVGGGNYGILASNLSIGYTGGLLAYGHTAAVYLMNMDETLDPSSLPKMLGSTAYNAENPADEVVWMLGVTTYFSVIGEGQDRDYARTVKLGAINPPAPSYIPDPVVTVPVTGDENTVNVQATVSGSTATVKDIKDADLAKVSGGETVEIDLSGLNKTIDTAKIPTTSVEKIAEQGGMSVKLSTATVTFDSKATETIADQAKGNTIELVVDDIKAVSLNAVQKEAVQKLDAALIIDAYLVSNGTRLCSEDKGGFGGGKATVALPYEIKGNRTAANYSVYYVDDAGKLEKLNASYDAATKAFVFDIEHFSNYVVAYDENAMLFVDVAESSFYYDAVLWAAKNGITDGTDATHFSPNMGTTRAQIVTFLWRAAGCPEPKAMTSFSDVAAGSYYEKAVAWALENGITKGTTATTFSPNMICTRAHIAAFMARYAGVKDADCQTSFTDVPVNAYYASAVAWMLANGVTEGTTATTYSPDADCTRAQIVTFLYRLLAE